MAFQIPQKYKEVINCKEYKYDPFTVKTYTIRPLNRRSIDDETYCMFPELIRIVPRGFSDLFVNDKYLLSIKGMEKFDGTSSIDNDDSDSFSHLESKETSIFDFKTVTKWNNYGILETYFKEKANGKFVIFQLFKFDNEFWIFGGSKNMHIVCQLDNPAVGNNLHNDIIRAICADLQHLSADELNTLSNRTIVGEYVDGKHLVYVETPYLVYFNIPNGVHLPTVKDIVPMISELPSSSALTTIRQMQDIEGVVLEYHNILTGEVIRQKHKSIWYIVWRCWREILLKRNKKDHPLYTTLIALQERLKQRSDQFLHLSDEELNKWNLTAEKFTRWIYESTYSLSDCGPFSNIGMARILHSFNNSEGSTPTKNITFSAKDNLAFPTMFNSVVAAAKFGLPVVVVMSGPSGSGKSTVASYLQTILQDQKIEVAVFSTDSYFMVNGFYNFDQTKLHVYHAKNLEAFQNSKAQVRIVDNTNLTRWEFVKYFNSSEKAVCIILYMNEIMPDMLAFRSVHKLPIATIAKMSKKFKIEAPAYYGLFPINSDLQPLLKQYNLTQTQKTPPHVTTYFVGGTMNNNSPPDSNLLNNIVDITITGYSISEAGQCLIVTSAIPGNHITLTTNNGFKPVDVGKQISVKNTTNLITNVTIPALYLPFY